MTQLATVGDLPLTTPNLQPRPKRSRDDYAPMSTAQPNGSPHAQPLSDQRPIAGSSRIQHSQHTSRTWSPNRDVLLNGNNDGYNLPLHSDELSRLPVHPVFDSDGAVPASRQAWSTSTDAPTSCPPTSNGIGESSYSYPTRQPNYSNLGPAPSASFSPIPSSAAIPTSQFGYSVNGDWPNDVNMLSSASDLGSTLDNHTLALLSTAPNSMEYVSHAAFLRQLSLVTFLLGGMIGERISITSEGSVVKNYMQMKTHKASIVSR